MVSHLLGVCSLVLQDGGNEDEAIAALLHDSLEDHPEKIRPEEIKAQFGEAVLSMVLDCTDTPNDYLGGEKPEWRSRKETYLAHLKHASPGGRRVSLADKVYNSSELLADLRREGNATWARFNAPKEEQLWYFRELVRRMIEAGQTGSMMREFERVVGEIEAIA